jgi:hypothetical protein
MTYNLKMNIIRTGVAWMKRVNVASALIYDDQGHKFAPVFIMVYVPRNSC